MRIFLWRVSRLISCISSGGILKNCLIGAPCLVASGKGNELSSSFVTSDST